MVAGAPAVTAYTNGLHLYVLTDTECDWEEPEHMVVLASDAREARSLARLSARRSAPRATPLVKAELGDRWTNPKRTKCRREPAGWAHVVLATNASA